MKIFFYLVLNILKYYEMENYFMVYNLRLLTQVDEFSFLVAECGHDWLKHRVLQIVLPLAKIYSVV